MASRSVAIFRAVGYKSAGCAELGWELHGMHFRVDIFRSMFLWEELWRIIEDGEIEVAVSSGENEVRSCVRRVRTESVHTRQHVQHCLRNRCSGIPDTFNFYH